MSEIARFDEAGLTILQDSGSRRLCVASPRTITGSDRGRDARLRNKLAADGEILVRAHDGQRLLQRPLSGEFLTGTDDDHGSLGEIEGAAFQDSGRKNELIVTSRETSRPPSRNMLKSITSSATA